jgi:hypothetical protein
MAFAADASSWIPPPQLEQAAQQEVTAERSCCGGCSADIRVCDGAVADTWQSLNIASADDLDRSSAGNMDAPTCSCSPAAICPQNAQATSQLDSTDGFSYEDMHTLRVFVIARASASGCGGAANADTSHGSGYASLAPASTGPASIAPGLIAPGLIAPGLIAPSLIAPASALETAAVADEVATPNADHDTAADGDSAAALAHAPPPAPAPPSAFALPSPPAGPAFGSAGFLKSVCDGLMHKLQPLTRLLVEIIPLSLPIDVLDARCFFRQVRSAAVCCATSQCFFGESNAHRLISIQCDPAVSHVQPVFLFLDDGHTVTDHIPPTVRAAAVLLGRMPKSPYGNRWRTLTCSCFVLAPVQVSKIPLLFPNWDHCFLYARNY